ncbi:hypothetical protein GCM10010271_12780 [Streptomyces kurssanovii]|nr:hypothetical protein GCM10010271_12780 [Streptomyces kurssanovii]
MSLAAGARQGPFRPDPPGHDGPVPAVDIRAVATGRGRQSTSAPRGGQPRTRLKAGPAARGDNQ